jgi:phosphoglycolate phosphatase-like HAD superfamily hydrolase
MVAAAAEALGVDASRCVMIGDTGGDVEAALAARAKAVLVPTDRTLCHEISDAREKAYVASTLNDAVSLVLRQCR